MMSKSQKISLWIGVLIPVLMIIGISLAILVPRLTVKPEATFLYTTGEGSDYRYSSDIWYEVEGNKLVLKERRLREGTNKYEDRYVEFTNGVPSDPGLEAPTLYIYDPRTDESREVSFDEAKDIVLSSKSTSPDGFEIKRGGGGADLFPIYYDYGSYRDIYLTKGAYSKKLDPEEGSNDRYYYNRFNFLGWIIE